jgi:hypothetical protein
MQLVEQLERYFARDVVHAVQVYDLRILFLAGKGDVDQTVILFLHMYSHPGLLSLMFVITL